MRKIYLFLIVCFSIVTAVSCGKYEDGPNFSLRSKANRIEGNYVVDYLAINDSVITRYWQDSIHFCFKFDKPDFKPYRYGALTIYTALLVDTGTVKQFCWMCTYRIEELGVAFRCVVDTSYYPGPTFYPLILPDEGYYLSFEITKLTNESMWLQYVDGNDVYEIHFKE